MTVISANFTDHEAILSEKLAECNRNYEEPMRRLEEAERKNVMLEAEEVKLNKMCKEKDATIASLKSDLDN